MNASRTMSIVSRRDIFTAIRLQGAAGAWIAAKERQQAAINLGNQTRLLKHEGAAVTSPSLADRMRLGIGSAFVRIGLRLQASANAPVVATSR